MKKKEREQIDWLITIVPFLLIISLFVLFIILPEQSNYILGRIRFFLGDTFGSYYIMIGIVFFCVSIYLAGSKYGNIILGTQGEKPKNSFFFMGSNDVYLRIGSRHFILFFFRMDDVCIRSTYHRTRKHSEMGWYISTVSLEFYSMEFLFGACSGIWFYVTCSK